MRGKGDCKGVVMREQKAKREQKVLKIDFSRRRLRERAEKYYDEGNYLSALRFTYKEMSLYGGDGDIYTMLSDIYENMELYSSAVNCWFRFMDNCSGEDLPDITRDWR